MALNRFRQRVIQSGGCLGLTLLAGCRGASSTHVGLDWNWPVLAFGLLVLAANGTAVLGAERWVWRSIEMLFGAGTDVGEVDFNERHIAARIALFRILGGAGALVGLLIVLWAISG